jgi:hypothetical protein
MIDGCQRSIDEQYNNSMVANEYLRKKMKTLQDASSDVDELEQLFKAKEWEMRKRRVY